MLIRININYKIISPGEATNIIYITENKKIQLRL